MSRLPSLSTLQIVRAPRKAGFVEAPDRGKGSHRALAKLAKGQPPRLVIVPMGKDIPRGTLFAILQQAGLTREQFLHLL